MRKEQRTEEQNKQYSIPGEAALDQVQILYQRTHSGKQYFENWKIFKMKSLYKPASRRSSLNSGQSEVFHMTAAAGP